MKKINILDCTLRDGGYFTNWDFSIPFAKLLTDSLIKSGVDIIEIGYKSPKKRNIKEFEGLFRYCPETMLNFLDTSGDTEFAFMIDAKEFISDNAVNFEYLSEIIQDHGDTLFSWVRIASYYADAHHLPLLVQFFKNNDFKVSCNLMGASLLTHVQLEEIAEIVETIHTDAFYFSDSFGDLTPRGVHDCIEVIRRKYSGCIGLHTHDNNGLAFANTIEAIQCGIDFIDSTVTGMGRGAGNVKTEQLLLYLFFKLHDHSVNPSELLEVIDRYFLEMQKKYRWGWDYSYMLSALLKIHPSYCMSLRSTNQFSMEQINDTLTSIDSEKREKFNEETLTTAINLAINRPLYKDVPLVQLPAYTPDPYESVLVIATGPSTGIYREAVIRFIEKYQPYVIECNPESSFFSDVSLHYIAAVLNWVRLKKLLLSRILMDRPIVTGIQSLPRDLSQDYSLHSFSLVIRDDGFSVGKESMTLSAYIVGMYAIGLASLSSPHVIYIAGYDGYTADPVKQNEMIPFWNYITHKEKLVSITPTTYPVSIIPVFKFLV